MAEKEQDVLRVARELFAQNPDWVTYFREVMGVGGVVRTAYNDDESLNAFEQSPEYAEIQVMLAKLRERGDQVESDKEPTRVITVRMPQSLHESLRSEAHRYKTSMNKLCIAKLLQIVEEQMTTVET